MNALLNEGDVHLAMYLLSFVDYQSLVRSVSINRRFYSLIYRLFDEFRGTRKQTWEKLKQNFVEIVFPAVDRVQGLWKGKGRKDLRETSVINMTLI